MAEFAIECPKCGSINTASTFIFAKKVIQCGTCGEEIDIKQSRITSKICPHCEKVFVYDQAKAKEQKCPSCGRYINMTAAETTSYNIIHVNCPQCACSVEIDKTKSTYFCPICDYEIDVKKEVARADLVTDTGISVIQYEGDNATFVWKHPIEDFNLGSQLIVHESQEAIFFLNGEALDTFGPGRHTLESENLPVLKKIYSLPTGSQTPFHAEVYFINKAVVMGMKWGTDSRVRFIDPATGIPLDIGASGELNLQVGDARKLLFKLVGTANDLINKDILSAPADNSGNIQNALKGVFRAPLMTEIKTYLATVIKEQNINIFEIDSHMRALSEALRERISPRFEEYGLTIPQFYIMNISVPEDDKNFKDIKALISQAYIGVKTEEVSASIAEAARQRKIIEEQTEAQLRMIRAQGDAEVTRAKGLAEAEVMHAKGYTEKDILESDVQKAYAEGLGKVSGNGGSGGGMASDLIGMMAGMKMVDNVFDKMGGAFSTTKASEMKPEPTSPAALTAQETWTCSCGESANTKKFCMNCGKPKPEAPSAWDCPACGTMGITSKFCPECGKKRPEATTWNCPECGGKDISSKFCPECGHKRPE